MKKSYKLPLLLVLFLSLLSCRKETPLEFEKKIMCEILPTLMDSLAIDRRILMTPPPIAVPIFDKNNKLIGLDSSNLNLRRIEFEKSLREIRQDTNVMFAIQDSVYEFNDEDWNTRNEYFKNIEFEKDSINSKLKYKIDIKCVTNRKLKYRSEFKEFNDFFGNKYDFELGGIISFSRIHFDKRKDYGILSASYLCGDLCGQGFMVYLKKNNNKWVIQKIIPTWIA